jgi:dGTPase
MSFTLVIRKPEVQQLERRGRRLVAALYEALHEDPKHLIPGWEHTDGRWSDDRRICDYVAGMTDSYAEKVYRRLFIPGFGSSSDEL